MLKLSTIHCFKLQLILFHAGNIALQSAFSGIMENIGFPTNYSTLKQGIFPKRNIFIKYASQPWQPEGPHGKALPYSQFPRYQVAIYIITCRKHRPIKCMQWYNGPHWSSNKLQHSKTWYISENVTFLSNMPVSRGSRRGPHGKA